MDLLSNTDMLMRFIFALILIMGLIGSTAWIAKILGFSPAFRFGRATGTRLQVVDTIPIGNQHKLVLIKRDQVEHLLCLNGQNGFVIEQGIYPKKTFTPPKFVKKQETTEPKDSHI